MNRRIEIAAAALLAALFIAIRWPLYTHPGLVLGWNSDAALFGMMARAMANGTDFPVFFWGQPYLGTLTSMITAVIAGGAWIGPLTLRIAAAIEVVLAIVLFTLSLRRIFGARTAMLTAAWLVAGPAFLFHFTIAPIGAEQLFFAAAVLFWFVTRETMTRIASWFVAGMIFGFGMYLHQGVMFIAGAIAIALFVERVFTLRRLLAGLAGGAIGYLPAAVALVRQDVRLYSRTVPGWSVGRTWDHVVDTAKSDLWLLISEPSVMGVVAGVLIIVFAISAAPRRAIDDAHSEGLPRWNRGTIVASLTIVFSFCFWFLSTYPFKGAVRYIVPALPMIYAFGAAGMLAWWDRGSRYRAVAIIAIALVTLPLYSSRVRQSLDVAAARTEQYTNWPGAFDPRPALQAIRDGGYSICYGEVWVAHKLEFLTDPTVRFVVVRSVHRTLPQSLVLIRRPGVKCYVENDGRTWAMSAEEEAMNLQSVELRARKAGILSRGSRGTPRNSENPEGP